MSLPRMLKTPISLGSEGTPGARHIREQVVEVATICKGNSTKVWMTTLHQIYTTLHQMVLNRLPDADQPALSGVEHACPLPRHQYQVHLHHHTIPIILTTFLIFVTISTIPIITFIFRLTLLSDQESWPLANEIASRAIGRYLTKGEHLGCCCCFPCCH